MSWRPARSLICPLAPLRQLPEEPFSSLSYCQESSQSSSTYHLGAGLWWDWRISRNSQDLHSLGSSSSCLHWRQQKSQEAAILVDPTSTETPNNLCSQGGLRAKRCWEAFLCIWRASSKTASRWPRNRRRQLFWGHDEEFQKEQSPDSWEQPQIEVSCILG